MICKRQLNKRNLSRRRKRKLKLRQTRCAVQSKKTKRDWIEFKKFPALHLKFRRNRATKTRVKCETVELAPCGLQTRIHWWMWGKSSQTMMTCPSQNLRLPEMILSRLKEVARIKRQRRRKRKTSSMMKSITRRSLKRKFQRSTNLETIKTSWVRRLPSPKQRQNEKAGKFTI